ncbi:hypothetical protein [Lactobacillus gigeriorum]|uniref:Uncharacterized protein n=1 Tax=Lactobacillus gigeriorum DSM 23908 = CRBIP 24.85 TaxID=1423751 RepID=I7LDS6_9LACO|nr:hypothetical protein [Lactobacillus gigeriorum]KRN09862.1 hypothetical protein FC38_GL001262 [Lactobacillus gigeriorum DSM 23908 = CRBIP 24.85]CCI87576.1 Protein of unknown function [Lactobacillus gigeriorum DSM 23908 = CRBIP 24.85]
MQKNVENEHEVHKCAKKKIPNDMWLTNSIFANTSGEGDRRASESDLKAIIQSASLDDSYDTLDNFSMADLNLIDLQNYKVLYSQVNDEPEVISADNEQFLIDHGLVRIDRRDGKYKLSKAVLLLFGKYKFYS